MTEGVPRAKWVGSQLVLDDRVCGICGLVEGLCDGEPHEFISDFDITGGRLEPEPGVVALWLSLEAAR